MEDLDLIDLIILAEETYGDLADDSELSDEARKILEEF